MSAAPKLQIKISVAGEKYVKSVKKIENQRRILYLNGLEKGGEKEYNEM